ncbi:alpha/beta hydrolase-fold protein [Pseudoduganella sp. UC29_106]|uniref:alpha/beta hydrolase-fold protein n=1 Tax=Pseudoduganella sp. UC29_106 TaxID=3374553 RepID=UPI003758086F
MPAPRPARPRRTVLAAALLAPTLVAASLPTPALADSVTVPLGAHSASFSTPDASARLRSYTQSTTMQLRDNAPQTVEYSELDNLPRVRSGNLAFDALFALAITEMKQDSVAAIKDGSYNGGNAIPCECFETGEKWHYVWTRDLSYAAALGLSMLDPQRARNSLMFKLSGYRAGKPANAQGTEDGLQIVQDTGSGGSWPVSTDRVSWAFGAEEALKSLPELERASFEEIALKALSNTIENDRLAAFDAATGLYTGEESFLDWREQSYAAWIVNDIASMASSKALSTNAAHYKALTLAAELARRQDDTARAQRYDGWAADLKSAVNARLWLKDAGMYSSLTAGHFDGAPMHKFDWLGQSLAIITGIADAEQARSIMAHYPHGPEGAPVIWPQQQDVPVYHNRAIWPFVTAYGLKAAAMTRNVAVADAAYATLMRGASLNLSNMENLEWTTGQPMLEHPGAPQLNGPVINSKRQLWSVGAYVGMVVQQVFGISATTERLSVRPFITSRLRREAFAGSDVAELSGLVLHGKRINVRLILPPAVPLDGYYEMGAGTLNGAPMTEAPRWADLGEDNTIELRLGALMPGRQQITRVDVGSFNFGPAAFGPHEPVVTIAANASSSTTGQVAARDGGTSRLTAPAHGRSAMAVGRGTSPTLHIAPGAEGERVTFNVYRDGKLVASKIAAGPWSDRNAGSPAAAKSAKSATAGDGAGTRACYAVEAVFVASGNRSHHSAPLCTGAGAVELAALAGVASAGRHAIQLRYTNAAHKINLGITNGVKWLRLRDAEGKVAAEGVVQLPHALGEAWSTPLYADLKPGAYSYELDGFFNMSYLQSNSSYADAGGTSGQWNAPTVHAIRIQPTAAAPAPVKRGTLQIIDGFKSPQLGNERKLRIYLPPGYEENGKKRYPVLYMHDGQNLFDAKTAAYGVEWNIDEVADRMIAEGSMQEVIIVGIDNTADRIAEYTPCCDPKYGGGKLNDYAKFIVKTVKPWVDGHYRTLRDRRHTAVMGSSLGGIASVYIGQHYPQVFSMASGVSSSFWWNESNMVRNAPRLLPVKFYIDAGDGDGWAGGY